MEHDLAWRMTSNVLTFNGGSSSIKFVLYAPGDPPRRLLCGQVERIGLTNPMLSVISSDGTPTLHQPIDAPDHERAAARLIDELDKRIDAETLAAIGHRVVHGGPNYSESRLVNAELITNLKKLYPLDPNHLPGEIALIEAFGRRFPSLPQVACFDTEFHHDMPRVAQLLPIPRRYEKAGLRRYGFHGLSYAYLMEELARVAGPKAAESRVILAHLGAGASMAAIRNGKCIDTTMAFTPTAGLVMATRSGDLDPGVLIYLMRNEPMDADRIDNLVNRESGLLGVSGISPDMRDLLAQQASDPRAAEAVALFCYQAKKWIGAFAAALGGLDTLVFAGGIGENAPEVRARISSGLDFLGVDFDTSRNRTNGGLISTEKSRVGVWVLRTDEELMIAKNVWRILARRQASQ